MNSQSSGYCCRDSRPPETDGHTPLHFAILNESGPMVDLLLGDDRIDVNGGANLPPLMTAVTYGSADQVSKLLMRDDVDIEFCFENRMTALYIAALQQDPDKVRLLLDHGALRSCKVGGATAYECALAAGSLLGDEEVAACFREYRPRRTNKPPEDMLRQCEILWGSLTNVEIEWRRSGMSRWEDAICAAGKAAEKYSPGEPHTWAYYLVPLNNVSNLPSI